MRSAAVLALLLCAGPVLTLPVNSPVNKGDSEVMKCIIEVISDSLSKPSPLPTRQECLEILREDARILSILRHQNLLKELQDLALQGAKERSQQQQKHSSFEEELSEVLENQSDQSRREEVKEEAPAKGTKELREDALEEEESDTTEGPQAPPEPGKGSAMVGSNQTPVEEEEEAAPGTRLPESLPSQKHPSPQAGGDSVASAQGLGDKETGLRTEQGQQVKKQDMEEEEGEQEEAGETAAPKEEGPTAVLDAHLSLGHREIQKGDSQSEEALALDGAGKTRAEEARPPKGKGEKDPSRPEEDEEEEAVAGAPAGPFQDGKSGEPEQEEPEQERLSREWEDTRRWSKMDQLAKELTAEKRLDREGEVDDPDRSMKLPFRTRAYGFQGPGPQLRRGWRPSSREDSIEAGLPLQARSFPEERREEEGSANRRAEDQELESLSAIEAELEKVAHQLQALRRG